MPNIDSLKDSGRALWDGVSAARKITPSLTPVLFNACRIADSLDGIAETLADAPLTVENSRGDETANPLFAEHRQQSMALARILASMGIDKLEMQPEAGEKSIAEMVSEAVAAMKA